MDGQTQVKDHRNYFGRTMRFVDDNGNEYPEAFVIVDKQDDLINKRIVLRAIIYKSITEFEAGAMPIPKTDGGIREIQLRAERFDKFILSQSQQAAAQSIGLHAQFDAIKDAPKGDGTFESFFAGASAVIMPPQE